MSFGEIIFTYLVVRSNWNDYQYWCLVMYDPIISIKIFKIQKQKINAIDLKSDDKVNRQYSEKVDEVRRDERGGDEMRR